MKDTEPFRHTLVRMVQEGSLDQILGCPIGRHAQLEFQLVTYYRVRLKPKTATVQERDEEIVMRCVNRRWNRVRRSVYPRGEIVIDRQTGKIVQTPLLGVARPIASAGPPRPAPRRRSLLAVAS